MQEKNHWVQTQ